MAKKSINEAEVEAFNTLNVYKLLITTYICLGKIKNYLHRYEFRRKGAFMCFHVFRRET